MSVEGVGQPDWQAVREGAPTYSLANRIVRFIWRTVWILFASWTPPGFTPWRLFLLRLFGASVSRRAFCRSSARIWLPSNLHLADYASIGPEVTVYNVALVKVGSYAVVSQKAVLCTAGHDVDRPGFPLVAAPIVIGDDAWVAAEAFVGQGVTLGEGAVLGARGVAFTDLEPNSIYVGNPCVLRRRRQRVQDS